MHRSSGRNVSISEIRKDYIKSFCQVTTVSKSHNTFRLIWPKSTNKMTTQSGSKIACKERRTPNKSNGGSPRNAEFEEPRSLVLPSQAGPLATTLSSNSTKKQVVNRGHSSAYSFIPRVVPNFSPNNGFARNSAIRSTLGGRPNHIDSNKPVDSFRRVSKSAPSICMERVPPSRSPALLSGPSRKPISDLLKIAKYMDDRGREDIEEEEKDAALALLVLQECSRQITDMTRGWSHLNVVPLCDFVVAQRKCQTMLNSIENLKEMKIRNREHGPYQNVHKGAKPAKEKNVKFHEEKCKTSRSSSVVSIVNVPSSPSNREKILAPRSSSMSSERTLTYSPPSSDGSTPSPVTTIEGRSSSNNYSPYQAATSLSAQTDKVFVPFADRRHLGKIGKTSKSGKNRNAHMRCLHCSSTETPEWRKGPGGPTTLCNACGLFYKKLIKKFGEGVATSIMKSRQIENPQDRKIPRFARM